MSWVGHVRVRLWWKTVKGLLEGHRARRDDIDKYNIQERTDRVEREGVEHLSVQGFSSSMKLETHLRTMDGLEAPVL